MAYRVTNGAGTSFNTTTNWDEGVNTPSIHASTNITVSAGGVFSATFTAPNTTNACTGVLVPIAAVGSAGNCIATLQELSVDVAGATATIAITSLKASSHVFFKFTTPYVFTGTGAGRYRIKMNTSGASGTTSIAADSGGANFAYLAFMNNNVVPTTGDDVFFVSPNQGSDLNIDLDTSPSIGSGTNTAAPTFRSWGNGMVFANAGFLSWQTGTSRTVTCKGNVIEEIGGGLKMGTTSAKISLGVQARLAFDQNGVNVNYGYAHLTGAKTQLQGTSLTYKKSNVVSGVGTAASPLVFTDSVDWSVGDEVVFMPISDSATNYNELESRFIITKNSATSYVLSSTAGGAETALVYTHAGAPGFNITRPVLIDTTNSTYNWYGDVAETTSVSNVDFDGCRLENIGSTTAGKATLLMSNSFAEFFTADDVVFKNLNGTGIYFGNNSDIRSFTWLIFYDYNPTNVVTGAVLFASFRNKTFTNCYAFDSQTAGFFLTSASTCTFTDCGAWACSRTSATAQSAWQLTNSSNILMNRCTSNCNRSFGTELSTAPGVSYIDCSFGTDGTNGASDVYVVDDSYNTALFDNCLFGSATLIDNTINMAAGSEIKFDQYNQTANRHFWYTPQGLAQSTGAGLPDTTVKTAGSLAVRIDATSSTVGFDWSFKILADSNSAVSIFGFIRKNTLFATDIATVDLYLPGLVPGIDTPTDSFTMPDTVDEWNVFIVAGSYVSSIPRYAIIVITAKTTTSGAYIYVDDFYNGSNPIVALDVWDEGKPSEIMFEQLGDADSVWNVVASTVNTAGTTGRELNAALSRNEFLALN